MQCVWGSYGEAFANLLYFFVIISVCLLVKLEACNKMSDHVFAITVATTWNQLPQKVRTATTTEQFSRFLKTHLFNLDWSCGSLLAPPARQSNQWTAALVQVPWLTDSLIAVQHCCLLLFLLFSYFNLLLHMLTRTNQFVKGTAVSFTLWKHFASWLHHRSWGGALGGGGATSAGTWSRTEATYSTVVWTPQTPTHLQTFSGWLVMVTRWVVKVTVLRYLFVSK